MTLEEFDRKWGNIRVQHDDGCPKKFSFDFETCNCGLDEEWDRRTADLATVYPHELQGRKFDVQIPTGRYIVATVSDDAKKERERCLRLVQLMKESILAHPKSFKPDHATLMLDNLAVAIETGVVVPERPAKD